MSGTSDPFVTNLEDIEALPGLSRTLLRGSGLEMPRSLAEHS